MSPIETVRTARLALEPLTPEHARVLFAPLQDPRLYTWISTAHPESEAALAARYARLVARAAEEHAERWLGWAVRRESDGRYVGKMDANVVGAVATNVGYLFFPDFWGQGYATEAVAGVLAHLPEVLEWRATVTLGNTASVRVLERVGFVTTRTLPANDTLRGVLHDDLELVWKQ